MTKTLLAKLGIAVLATGTLCAAGATAASAAPAVPRTALSCELYLAGAGYVVGPKSTSACNTAARGFPAVCEVGLEAIKVSATDARRACALGAQ
ncbi:hypothetical protein AB0878_19855 [Amycolatopsis sp. NPDC047767]|uniref:hypothetical protein n=1 Tax=Amycolatopsis sp. NPDC047767 TaxID=3156765 RepID=UPI0034560E8D